MTHHHQTMKFRDNGTKWFIVYSRNLRKSDCHHSMWECDFSGSQSPRGCTACPSGTRIKVGQHLKYTVIKLSLKYRLVNTLIKLSFQYLFHILWKKLDCLKIKDLKQDKHVKRYTLGIASGVYLFLARNYFTSFPMLKILKNAARNENLAPFLIWFTLINPFSVY